MRVMLDENIHIDMVKKIIGHDVSHVTTSKLSGLKNGQLLRHMEINHFDAFITMDQQLPHQQNLAILKIKVIVIKAVNNRLETLEGFLPKIYEALKKSDKLVIVK